MAKSILKKTYWESQNFTDPSENVTLAKSGRIISTTEGLYLGFNTDNSKVTIDGEILAEYRAVYLEGDGTKLTVSKSGRLNADVAVVLSGLNSSGVNNGTMIADDDILVLAGGETRFTNNGAMRGEDAVRFVADDSVFTNGNKGVIEVWDNAVEVDLIAGETSRTVNKGLMMNAGGSYLFEGGASDDTFINTGKARGDVLLGDGNDRFDTRGGKFSGAIEGGAGNDTLYTDKASLKLVELSGGGEDRVFSTVTYTLSIEVETLTLIGKKSINGTGNEGANTLTGNAAANKLYGLAGADTLDGGKGNDRLTGGDDVDTFIFATGYGKDVITDFLVHTDIIDLSGWKAIVDIQDLKDNHMQEKGGNVIFSAGKDSLTLIGATADDIVGSDFRFQDL